MSYISPKPLSQYPFLVRFVLRRQRRVYGEVLAPAYLWGRLPSLFFAMLAMLGLFSRSRFQVSAVMRALVSIRVAQLNGCSFCVDLNAHHFLSNSGASEKAHQVARWRENSDLFTNEEKLILDYAEQMTSECSGINQAVIAGLRAHFSEDEIVSLTSWIAFQNMSAKFNTALGAEAHGFCEPIQ